MAPAQLGWRAGTPEPICEDNPEFVAMYWKAWENLHAHVREESAPNGFPHLNIAPHGRIAFDETIETALYARWGWRAAPISDTFLHCMGYVDAGGRAAQEQRPDGTLPMGEARGLPTAGYAALRILQISGSRKFADAALPALARRHAFFEESYTQRIPPAAPDGEPVIRRTIPAPYSPLGQTGGEIEVSPDAVAMVLLDSFALSELAKGTPAARPYEALARRDSIELLKLWNAERRCFLGINTEGAPAGRETLLPLFGLVSCRLPESVTREALGALYDPRRFARRVYYPLLSADDRLYEGDSGVEPLYQYIALRALIACGQEESAGRAAERMLAAIWGESSEGKTLFAGFGPETRKPAPGSEPNTVRAGLIPIAGLIEAVLGIDCDAAKREVTWNVRRLDKHGLRKIRMGTNTISLTAEPRKSRLEAPAIAIECDEPFTLRIEYGGTKKSKSFAAGEHTWQP